MKVIIINNTVGQPRIFVLIPKEHGPLSDKNNPCLSPFSLQTLLHLTRNLSSRERMLIKKPSV